MQPDDLLSELRLLFDRSRIASEDANTAVSLVTLLFTTLVEERVIPLAKAHDIVNSVQMIPGTNALMLDQLREALRKQSS